MNEAAVSNIANPDGLSEPDYFTTRLNEAQLAYERGMAAAKAAVEATLKAEQKTLERDKKVMQKFLRKLSPEEVAEAFEVSLDKVNMLAAKARTL